MGNSGYKRKVLLKPVVPTVLLVKAWFSCGCGCGGWDDDDDDDYDDDEDDDEHDQKKKKQEFFIWVCLKIGYIPNEIAI